MAYLCSRDVEEDRYSAPESETKYFPIAVARSSVFAPVPQAPLATVHHKEGQVMLQWHMEFWF